MSTEAPATTTQEAPQSEKAANQGLASMNEIMKPLMDKILSRTDEAKPTASATEDPNGQKDTKKEQPPEPPKTETDKATGDEKPHIKKLREVNDGLKAELNKIKEENTTKIAELEKSLGEAKSTFDPKEYERLKTERNEFDQLVRRLNVQEHPEFKSKFVTPVEKAITKAKTLVPVEKAAQVEALLRMAPGDIRDNALAEIVDGMDSQVKATQLIRQFEIVSETNASRDDEIKQNSEYWNSIEDRKKKEIEARQSSVRKEMESLYEDVLNVARDPKEGLSLFQKIEGDDKHNSAVERAVSEAKRLIFEEKDAVRLMQSAFESVHGRYIAPMLSKQLEDFKAENQKLSDEIKRLTSGLPKPGGGGDAKAKESKDFISETMRYIRGEAT